MRALPRFVPILASLAAGLPIVLPTASAADPSPRPILVASDTAWAQELALWNAASAGNSVAEYEAYLATYPKGKFAAIAKARIARLKQTPGKPPKTAPAPVAAEPSSPLLPAPTSAAPATQQQPGTAASRAAAPPSFQWGSAETEAGFMTLPLKAEIQGRLLSAGHDIGKVDGVIGPRTRQAIRLWQQSVGAHANGFLTPDQVAAFRQQTEASYKTWLDYAKRNGIDTGRAARFNNHDQPGPLMSDKDSRAFSEYD